VEFLIVGYLIGAPKYRSTITNHFRIWKRCVAVIVAVLFLQEQDHLRFVIVMAAKKETCGAWSGDWMIRPGEYQFVAEKGEKRKRLDFSHNRAQLFPNLTIMSFAGTYLLVTTPF
jgi:hypothetical protein